jgi:hypothetical protein
MIMWSLKLVEWMGGSKVDAHILNATSSTPEPMTIFTFPDGTIKSTGPSTIPAGDRIHLATVVLRSGFHDPRICYGLSDIQLVSGNDAAFTTAVPTTALCGTALSRGVNEPGLQGVLESLNEGSGLGLP